MIEHDMDPNSCCWPTVALLLVLELIHHGHRIAYRKDRVPWCFQLRHLPLLRPYLQKGQAGVGHSALEQLVVELADVAQVVELVLQRYAPTYAVDLLMIFLLLIVASCKHISMLATILTGIIRWMQVLIGTAEGQAETLKTEAHVTRAYLPTTPTATKN